MGQLLTLIIAPVVVYLIEKIIDKWLKQKVNCLSGDDLKFKNWTKKEDLL